MGDGPQLFLETIMIEAVVNVVADVKLMCMCVFASQVIALAIVLVF